MRELVAQVVSVSSDNANIAAEISADSTFPPNVWGRIIQICVHYDPGAQVSGKRITMTWSAALSAIPEIASLRAEHGFVMDANPLSEERLRRVTAEREAVRRARARVLPLLRPEELTAQLQQLGFDFDKRALTDFQLRDIARLASIPHGANFSVPGAGKTTVALALHLLSKEPGMHLLVVCPKNALPAWDSVVDECMRSDAPDRNSEAFWRLEGDDERIGAMLAAGGTRFVITYDKLIRVPGVIRTYLTTHPVHVILDESHRIKSGDFSLRGRIVGELAPLPIRRDILSGTPMPNGLEDLTAQVDFLWPGHNLGRRLSDEGNAREVLRELFVRTTKRELDLPPIIPHFERVEMGAAQLSLYGYLKSAVIPELRKALHAREVARPVRTSVMRMLQATSNPESAVNALAHDSFRWGDLPNELFDSVIAEGTSNKILYACQLARELAAQEKRCIIWTIFLDNIDTLVSLLGDVGVTSIDGRVPSGSSEDISTREGRVRWFHQVDGPRVLIANPAACSEGISLHLACHDAIYLDRSYNAAHYLQSRDRIHRLGLPPGTETNITILQSVASEKVGTIDHSVSRRLRVKMEAMDLILNDEDIRQIALDEENADAPIERDVDLEDVQDLLEQLLTGTIPSGDDEA